MITDITIETCTKANPLSSCQLDPTVWKRVDKDIYLQSSWLYSGFVHYKSKDEKDLTYDDYVVTDVRISRSQPSNSDAHSKWERRPGGLWIKRTSTKHENDFHKIITALDVLYGPDAVDPRPNWEVKSPAILVRGGPDARLTTKYGNHLVPDEKPPLRLRRDGKFKILQVSDLHLSTGTGDCRDLFPPSKDKCEADPRTIEFMSEMVDVEHPDLVVLSGDQVNGETAPDTQTAIFKYAHLLGSRKVPYATVFGNHDDIEKSSLSRENQMALISGLPYSLSQPGPKEISGVGNYYLEVLAPSSSHSALTIYLMDSHGSREDGKGYDSVHWDQVQWFKTTARDLKDQHDKYAGIHLDMAFIHIPLPEYRGPPKDKNDKGEKLEPIYGEWREGVMSPKENTGLRDALVDHGVSVVSCGHDHVNSYCGLSTKNVPVFRTLNEEYSYHSFNGKTEDRTKSFVDRNKIWLCYGGGAGYGGYGGYGGYFRRVRVFEFDSNDASLRTWLRTENEIDKRSEEIVLVRDGRPAQ